MDSVGAGGASSLSIDTAGMPVGVYVSQGTTPGLHLVRCRDSACSDATSTLLAADDTDVGEGVAIGADGLPVVAYRDVTAAQLVSIKCRSPMCPSHWTRR